MTSQISDSDIIEITQYFVDVANQDGTLNTVLEQYRGDRSMAIHINGTRIRTGFIIKDGQIQMLNESYKPTVTVTLSKESFWDIINSDNANVARAKIFTAVYTEERLIIDPPPGVQGGALHLQNIIAVFSRIAQNVMG